MIQKKAVSPKKPMFEAPSSSVPRPTQSRISYTILGSGSSGNAVLVGNILVDCGLPFSKIKSALPKTKTLLISHKHSDHLNPATLKRIRKLYPGIQVCANWDIAQLYPRLIDTVLTTHRGTSVDGHVIYAFEGCHDVPELGFYWKERGLQLIYSTDSFSMKNVPEDLKFDAFFLEANYDAEKVLQIELAGKDKTKTGFSTTKGSHRHLSIQQHKAFYYSRRKTRDALDVELHKSSRYY